MRVAGTTIGSENRQWLVSALGFELEIELAPRMIFLRYDDVPGVIGRVGTLLGEAGVNIANMAVSRNREGGKALMALSIDTPASPEVLASARRRRRRRVPRRHDCASAADLAERPDRSTSAKRAADFSCYHRPKFVRRRTARGEASRPQESAKSAGSWGLFFVGQTS